MKKFGLFLLWLFLYFVFVSVQLIIAIGLNMAVFGRGDGGITAIGGLLSFWTSYKIVKAIRSRFWSAEKIF